MSKPVNPMAVGGFTLGALALLVAGLLMFGGGQLFNTDKIRYVIFFDSSLNGLEVGAPVKMQGVKIGAVVDIALQLNAETGKVYKPVVIEIDRKSFLGPGGKVLPPGLTHQQQLKNRDLLVARGFRARLETQSLLTGLLYVNFDVYEDKPAQFSNLDYQGLIELPCVPTTVDEIRNTAEEVVKKIRNLPLEEIVHGFADTLHDIRKLLESEEMKQSNAALAKTLQGMEKTMSTLNQHLEPLLKETNQTVSNANGLVVDSRAVVKESKAMVEEVRLGMKPILASTEKTLNAATTALDKAKSTLGTVEGAVGPDSTLEETLLAVKDATRSIKDLSDYLERHPESLISGKDH